MLCDFLCSKYGLNYSLANQLPAFMTYFSCGMAFYLYWEPLNAKLNYAVIPAAALFLLCKKLELPLLSLIFMPPSLTVLLMWAGTRLTVFSSFCKKDFSYSMYLVHFPLIMLFIQYGFFSGNAILALFGVTGISFLAAYILDR